jgi:pimeloyl-ACP methyl ester carboxylesterase
MDGSQRINMIMPAALSDAELRAIRAPTLLLIAEHEILYEAEPTLESAMTRMPGLEAEIVQGAHHLAAMAQPDAVNARIVDFLQADGRKTAGMKIHALRGVVVVGDPRVRGARN